MTEAPGIPTQRRIFANRTLNMRSIRAVGYDMDYTLVHYAPEAWEDRAYEHIRRNLERDGWPVSALRFDPRLVMRGLIIDKQLGNVVKANRFGYVRRAFHGTRPLGWEELREAYARTIVDLSEPRYEFMNTLFSLSEACFYLQLVDMLDRRELPEVLGYLELYERVRSSLDEAHTLGELKAEILAAPDLFIIPDPETPLALLDQKDAGKKLLLITNSEWSYTRAIMAHAFDPYLPKGIGWRDLFDVVIVGARKPLFFMAPAPLLEVVTEEGLLRPARGIEPGGAYFGGSASVVERDLGMSGDEILYVGDHVYGDVHVSKSVLRWRTALVLRELEDEILALEEAAEEDLRLSALMRDKEALEAEYREARLHLQRLRVGRATATEGEAGRVDALLGELRSRIDAVDALVRPLAEATGRRLNPNWGLLLRVGNDKSHLARQLERSADVYTSRVSNFLRYTPYAYLRAPRGTMPHDPQRPGSPGGA